jgi:hypothetical protein
VAHPLLLRHTSNVLVKRYEVDMKDAQTLPIDLESGKIEFLEAMATKHGLADAGKAVRCLINYARENPDKHADIFDEVRCLDC